MTDKNAVNYRELDVQEAVRIGKTMPFAYFARLSEVSVGYTPEEISLEELTEARFFGPDGEIRICETGEGLSAAELKEVPGVLYIDKKTGLLPGFGSKLVKRQYIVFDEDGQGGIAATRLLHWEE